MAPDSELRISLAMAITSTPVTTATLMMARRTTTPATGSPAYYVHRVPLFHPSNFLVREALSGWEITGVTALQSGNPLNITDFGVHPLQALAGRNAYGYYACPDTPNTSSFAIKKLNPRAPGNVYFDNLPFF